MSASQSIKNRIREGDGTFFANDNISQFLIEGDIERLQEEVQEKVQALLDSLVIDTANDHNTKDTAKRIAKMYLREVFAGRYETMPTVTEFPNAKHLRSEEHTSELQSH